MGRSLALHVRQNGDVLKNLDWGLLGVSYLNFLKTLVEDVLSMSGADIPWRYMEHHMGTSVVLLLGMNSGRPCDVTLPGGQCTYELNLITF